MKKKNKRPLYALIAFAVAVSVIGNINLFFRADKLQNDMDTAKAELMIAIGKCENEAEAARQWRAMYQTSVIEIAHLKEENEELTRRWEEVSFAYDELCHEIGWDGSGEFCVTFYCACPLCCGKNADGITATGTVATEGRTVAVDPAVIPLGSVVNIDGELYRAEDTGAAIKGKRIDLFVNDHNQALEQGTYRTTVKWRSV